MIAIFPESGLGGGNADPKTLDQIQNPHGFGEMRIAVVGESGLAEVGWRDIAERSAGIDDLDAIVKPIGSHRGIG